MSAYIQYANVRIPNRVRIGKRGDGADYSSDSSDDSSDSSGSVRSYGGDEFEEAARRRRRYKPVFVQPVQSNPLRSRRKCARLCTSEYTDLNYLHSNSSVPGTCALDFPCGTAFLLHT